MIKIKGHIIFIDDDKEEHELFMLAMNDVCECKILRAYSGEEGLKLIHENKENIFAIISDVQMPKMNGLQLKHIIDATPELKLMAIPFIFLSGATDPIIVKEAYSLGIQGFIEKTPDIQETTENLKCFVSFWSRTLHPNKFQNDPEFRDAKKQK